MKRFLKIYSIEQKLFFRSPDLLIFGFCMPLAVLALITAIGGGKVAGDSGMTFLQSSFAALSTVGICCNALMSIPIVMVDYRDKKILKHFYCSPCSPAQMLGAVTLCSGVTAVGSAVAVALAAIGIFGYRMPGSPLAFAGAWLLTAISIFSIGLMIASLCGSVKTLNVVTSLVYFPMLFLSGAVIPFELFPRGLQKVAQVLPLAQGIKLMKAASMGQELEAAGWTAALLVTITVVCTVVAVRSFRWE